jgi:hypothetical protein
MPESIPPPPLGAGAWDCMGAGGWALVTGAGGGAGLLAGAAGAGVLFAPKSPPPLLLLLLLLPRRERYNVEA